MRERYDAYGYPCWPGSQDYSTADEYKPLAREWMPRQLGGGDALPDTENRTEPGQCDFLAEELPAVDISRITG
jgi:hypothetical protein